MPIDTDTLLTIAELAVGLIGVSGIVVVFMSRDGIDPVDRMRFVLLLTNGMVVAVAAFIPIWIAYFVESVQTIWRLSSACGFALALPISALVARHQNSLPTWKSSRAKVASLFRYGPWALAGVGFLLPTLNILAWPFAPNQAFYEAALIATLIQVSLFFAELAIYPSRIREREQNGN